MSTAFGENGAYGVDAVRDRPLSLRKSRRSAIREGGRRGERASGPSRAQVGGLDTPCRFYIALMRQPQLLEARWRECQRYRVLSVAVSSGSSIFPTSNQVYPRPHIGKISPASHHMAPLALRVSQTHYVQGIYIGMAKKFIGRAGETEAHIREALHLSPRGTFRHAWRRWPA